LRSDASNCNQCGRQCDFLNYCCDGNCQPPDDNNCGGCGIRCGGVSSCCVCPERQYCTNLACLCLS
jgi:hypothetical protein